MTTANLPFGAADLRALATQYGPLAEALLFGLVLSGRKSVEIGPLTLVFDAPSFAVTKTPGADGARYTVALAVAPAALLGGGGVLAKLAELFETLLDDWDAGTLDATSIRDAILAARIGPLLNPGGAAQLEALLGSLGDDTLVAARGSILASAGNDHIVALDASVLVDYLGQAGGVQADLAAGFAWLAGKTDRLFGVHDLRGSRFDDMLRGSAESDTLDGATGADSLDGGAGDDWYHVDTQADLVFEAVGGGLDRVLAAASVQLYANIEELWLAKEAGNAFGVGNALANILVGNGSDNWLLGGDGDDALSGDAGADALFGEAGADVLKGEAGSDTLLGGAGDDTLEGGAGADALHGEAGDDSLTGGEGFVTDILTGGAGRDTLDGASGAHDYDLLDGGAGDDTYRVDTAADLTFETAGGGIDTVIADCALAGIYLWPEVENLTLLGTTPFGVGNALANAITGSAAANWLLGGAGADTLAGGAGDDVLFGEAGGDSFVFAAGTGRDLVADYDPAADSLVFQGYAAIEIRDIGGGIARVNFRDAAGAWLEDVVLLQGAARAGATLSLGAIDAGNATVLIESSGRLEVLGQITGREISVDGPVTQPVLPLVVNTYAGSLTLASVPASQGPLRSPGSGTLTLGDGAGIALTTGATTVFTSAVSLTLASVPASEDHLIIA